MGPRECKHIKANGQKCEGAALRGQSFCYFHTQTRVRRQQLAGQPTPEPESRPIELEIPLLEDANAVQVAVSLVASALAANKIEPRRAGVLIYALQLASNNLSHTSLRLVREFSNTVTTFALAEDGSPIAA